MRTLVHPRVWLLGKRSRGGMWGTWIFGSSGTTQCEGEGGEEGAGVGEEIAVRCVKGKVVFVAEVHADAGSLVARGGGGDSAIGIDGRGDSCVGGTKDPAVIFDGTHANHVQVLPGGAGVAVPAVVGDVDQDIGSLLRELADFVSEDGFVTDEGSVGVTACFEDGALFAGFEETYFVQKTLCEEEELFVGNVLAKGDEMHLVVMACEGTVGSDKRGAVVERVARF